MTQSASGTNPQRWEKRRVLLFLAPLFLFYSYLCGGYPEYLGPNEASRAMQTIALYERGELTVNEEVKRFGNNCDIIEAHGRRYPDKVPGSSFWLLLFAPIVDLLTQGRLSLVQLLYFGRVLALTLPFVFFLYALGRALEEICSSAAAWGLVLAYALGTNASVYATVYFSHDLAAIACGMAFILLWQNRRRRRFIMAGLLAGLAVLLELSTSVIFMVLAGFAFFQAERGSRIKSLAQYLIGSLPMILALMVYDRLCFGSPFLLPFHFQAGDHVDVNKTTFLGFGFPTLKALFGLLFSPACGLFFYSPWLFTSFFALFYASRFPTRTSFLVSYLAPWSLIILISSYHFWHGGWSIGPRYLTACLPFFLFPLAVLLGCVASPWRHLLLLFVVATAGVSIAAHSLVLISYIYYPLGPHEFFSNFVTVLSIPFLKSGHGAYTAANFFGASVPLSQALYVLLLAFILTTYLISFLWRGGIQKRRVFIQSCFLSVVLFALWLSIGSKETLNHAKAREFFGRLFWFDDAHVREYSLWKQPATQRKKT